MRILKTKLMNFIRKFFFAASLLLMVSCSFFRENYRTVKYNVESGSQINLIMYEEKELFGEKRSLRTYINDYYLKGSECKAGELQKFSNELWAEIIKKNDLSAIQSGTLYFLRNQSESKPEYCGYIYLKTESGGWTKY